MKAFAPSAWLAVGLAVCLAVTWGGSEVPAAWAGDGETRPTAAQSAAQPATQPGTGYRFAVGRSTTKEQKLIDALNRPLPEPVQFTDKTLTEVLKALADMCDIRVMPDTRSLEDAQINLDEERISIALADVTLRSALNLILEQFELAYVVENGVLKILWEDDAENRLTTLVYDVRPLIEAGYTEDHLILVIQNETSGVWFPDDPNKRIDALIGGLAIRQTQRVHDEVEALLQDVLKLTERHAQARSQGERGGAVAREPKQPAEADAPGGITAHPVEPGGVRLGPVGQVVRPQWRVVIYDVTPLTEKGYDAQRLSEVVRAVVRPEDWTERRTYTLPGGSPRPGAVSPSGGFFCVLSIPDARKTSAHDTVRQFGGVTGGMGTGGMGGGTALFPQEAVFQARIEPLGNMLVVYQSPSVHKAIASFLQELNRMPGDKRGA